MYPNFGYPSGAGGPLAPFLYTAQLATACRCPVAIAGAKQGLARTRHIARDTIVNPRLAFPNYFINGSGVDTGTGAPSTISAAIEYPVGTLTQIKWAGSATTSIPDITISALSDVTTGVTIPAGAVFFVQSYFQNINFILTTTNPNGQDTANGEIYRTANSGLSDQTMVLSGSWSGGSLVTDYCYSPSLIVAPSFVPSVLMIGNSLQEHFNDTYTGASGDIGVLARSIGPLYPYTKHARAATTAAQFLASHSNADVLAQYCSHISCEYGANDLSLAGSDPVVVSDRMRQIALLYPNCRTFQSTCTNLVTSNNAFSTLGGQTANATVTPKITSFNTGVRAGIPGMNGYIEINDTFSTARNSGIWKTTGRVIADANITATFSTLTSATANFTAADDQKSATIVGAGVASANLAVIMTVVNSTTVTVSVAASTTVTNGAAWIQTGTWTIDGQHGSQFAYLQLLAAGIITSTTFVR